MLIPFVLGWAGGFLAWKAFDPSCKVGKSGGLYGIKPKRPRRGKKR